MNKRFTATRFAPSPTGPLHFGSLVCAVASYVIARQLHAKWLVRIEDIDLQRCKSEYTEDIVHCLHAHGLQEDDQILLQSERHSVYVRYIEKLKAQGLTYACNCSRKMVKERAEFYDGYCRDRNLSEQNNALRFKNLKCPATFNDMHLGKQHTSSQVLHEDPVLKRADGQYNYNLAVIADDIEQNIDLIVRGADLLDQTPLHQHLFDSFGKPSPTYFHLPLAVHSVGVKYAKQSFSAAIDATKAYQNIQSCLLFMGVPADALPKYKEPSALIEWAIKFWQPSMLANVKEIVVVESNGVYSPQYSLLA